MPDKDLQVGKICTKDQAKRLMLKVFAFIPLACMFIAGISMSHVRYEETGKLTALGWLILFIFVGAAMTGLVWWQVGK